MNELLVSSSVKRMISAGAVHCVKTRYQQVSQQLTHDLLWSNYVYVIGYHQLHLAYILVDSGKYHYYLFD